MNPIAPHGPPVLPTAPGRPTPAAKGGSGSDPAFDDFLSSNSSKATPPLIEDHSPPPTLPEDSDPTDPADSTPIRPMRWKGSRSPVSDSPATDAAGTGVQLTSQVDLRAMVPAVAMALHWSPPPPLPNEESPATNDTGTIQGISAGGTSATGPASGVQGSALAMATDSMSANAGVIIAPSSTQTAGLTDTASGSTPVANPALPGQMVPLPIGTDLPAAPDASFTGWTVPLPIGTDQPAAAVPTGSEPSTSPPVATAQPPAPAAFSGGGIVPPPTGSNLPLAVDSADGAAAMPVRTDALPSPVLTISGISAPAILVLPPGVQMTGPSVPVPATATQSSSLIVQPPVSGKQTFTTDVRMPVAPATSDAPAEMSAPSTAEAAKFADLPIREIRSARNIEKPETQTPGNESLKPADAFVGTPVAKTESVVTATLTNNEKEAEAAPLPKRDGKVSAGTTVPNRLAATRTSAAEALVSTAVTGTSTVGASVSQAAETPVPGSTAAQQVVKVETLLQNALSVGQSVRPNGSGQLEMRVRLDGGTQDVTVRMQVTNDKMQVTFQTDSPEMRKALEQGWTQFSADAAQSSTLSLSQPRFETNQPATLQVGQPDTAAFSSDQQNSRRQDSAPSFADELTAPVASQRVDPGSVAAATPTTGSSAGRRLSNWA